MKIINKWIMRWIFYSIAAQIKFQSNGINVIMNFDINLFVEYDLIDKSSIA